MIQIEIPIKPVPKARPRFSSASGGVYTPYKTQKAERDIALLVKGEMASKGLQITEAPLAMHLCFKFKKKDKSSNMIPIGDIDNFCKLAMDSLQGIVYVNDKQIVHLSATKMFYSYDAIYIKIDLLEE